MERVVKLFRNGRNQAVRLPVQFEFDTDRVYIRQDENGDVILSKNKEKSDSWEPFFELLKNTAIPADFLDVDDRNQDVSVRDPFEGIK
ncbi:AbrB/MazE/SpoVT family DNA-binding domain-containing protein [Xenorhabdus bovienii]|uniref:antitoxin n=1 Tax=Xenorhabdus bovienii TaxID=40576 RepID=UPI0023B2F5A2|nr:AbrB/MazE/SpoVT family DNA-binding domain-containing protein [Xenorhabdus bovienii]MDE9465549.1 AbrB/MazE/SpoVT family DNA-binding domain-containing protein [Xenorhabdus bovienii]MDE9516786.1 AbrB/MazE/SpoVT family DNA-binding domain-containing protein [Xenorhabdus bovienii]